MQITPSLLPGFTDTVLDSQRTFRVVVNAMAHPGRVLALPVLPQTPQPLYPSTAAVCLTLLDLDTPVWTDTVLSTPAVHEYLKFHCCCPFTNEPAGAAFALLGTDSAMLPLGLFAAGAPLKPEGSATLLIQVSRLANCRGKRLCGPGIAEFIDLQVAGLTESFWEALQENHQSFPQGVDVLLLSPDSVCGLPRTVLAAVRAAAV